MRMSTLRERRKEHKNKRAKRESTVLEILGDLLFYIPELLFMPFRIVLWLIRKGVKLLDVTSW